MAQELNKKRADDSDEEEDDDRDEQLPYRNRSSSYPSNDAVSLGVSTITTPTQSFPLVSPQKRHRGSGGGFDSPGTGVPKSVRSPSSSPDSSPSRKSPTRRGGTEFRTSNLPKLSTTTEA